MREPEVAEMIERHIDFYKEDAAGNRRSVQPPGKVVHALRPAPGEPGNIKADNVRVPLRVPSL
jgi:hypothetical protein